MCVNTPLGPSSLKTEVVRSIDVELEGCHVPIDMLVLPISDFDVILGMNWLNLYCAIIDCHNATLSFECNNTSRAPINETATNVYGFNRTLGAIDVYNFKSICEIVEGECGESGEGI